MISAFRDIGLCVNSACLVVISARLCGELGPSDLGLFRGDLGLFRAYLYL